MRAKLIAKVDEFIRRYEKQPAILAGMVCLQLILVAV